MNGARGGTVILENDSTAAEGIFIVNGGTVAGATGGELDFFDQADLGDATIIINGGEGEGGLCLLFAGEPPVSTTRLEVFGNGTFFNSDTNVPVTVGSIEGDGIISIGFHSTLLVGSNNLSTLFSGIIQELGALEKIGTGTLTLSGANTYEESTTIEGGTLTINNTTGSGTGTGPVAVNTGTLAGHGIISGAVTVGTGSGAGAFLAPAAGTPRKATLTLQSSLTFQSDATYTYTFKARGRQAKTDKVIANGVTINGGNINLVGTTQGTLRTGLVLTVISNTAATPISGTFANLPDGAIVTVNGNNFQADYRCGDGNDLTLTVVP